MVAIQSLLLSVVLASPSDTVLLDFTSDSCIYCEQMRPTVQRLETNGVPVKHINISRNQAWSDHYQIEGVPTYVMLSNNREVGRIKGRTSYDKLKRLVERAGGINAVDRNPQKTMPTSLAATNRSTVTSNPLDAETLALNATVRIGVEDERFRDFATGTIIDVHNDEALVLTCGHVFRDSRGKGRITVDLFSDGQVKTVPGKLIDYVADGGDIGLIVVRTPFRIRPVQVAPPSYQPKRGETVFTVGCDGGNQPSLRHSRVTYVNRYNASPANIEAAGVPVKGRSGGGLFTADGRLIGVCNAADEELREGVYASLPQVYQRLDRMGLKQIYLREERQFVNNSNAAIRPVNQPRATERDFSNSRVQADSPRSRFSFANETRPANLQINAPTNNSDVEVICIIRNRNDPGSSRTIVLDNPPINLMNGLRSEYQRQQLARSSTARQPIVTTSSSQLRHDRTRTTNVVRGQSER